ncbi:MAG: AMP-binding protein [Bacteroidota bacterium]
MKSLILNGKYYSPFELKEFANSKIQSSCSNWESSIYKFISDWISDRNIFEFHTSGSTSEPKLISFSRNDLIASAKLTESTFNLLKGMNALLVLPADFVAAKMMIVRSFVTEMNLILQEPTSNPFENISNIDFCAVVPLQLENGLKYNLDAVKNIKIILVGGAKTISQNIHLENIFETYGMTETLTHVAIRKYNGKHFYAVGNNSFSKDERDCLIIKSPHLNKITITNDIVELISEKEFNLLGRFDTVINSGGVKMFPELVENKLSELLNSKKYFISSIEDEILGRKVVLVLESNSLTQIESDTILESCNKYLNKFEMPRKIITIKGFIYTNSGKIKRMETLNSVNL